MHQGVSPPSRYSDHRMRLHLQMAHDFDSKRIAKGVPRTNPYRLCISRTGAHKASLNRSLCNLRSGFTKIFLEIIVVFWNSLFEKLTLDSRMEQSILAVEIESMHWLNFNRDVDKKVPLHFIQRFRNAFAGTLLYRTYSLEDYSLNKLAYQFA